MIGKILFGLLLILPDIMSYNMPLYRYKNNVIRMSMSENYLNHLQNKISLRPSNDEIKEMIKSAPTLNTSQIEIDNIYLNIYKMISLFFNRKAENIYFRPARELRELYYYDNKQLYKIPENTTIVSKSLRQFVITEMNNDIDGILI